MSTPFIQATGNGDIQQVQQVGSVQAQQPAPMQIVVNQSVDSVETADSGLLYWLACLFCNCCGLSAMALVLHCAAQGLWEQGGSMVSGASGVWRKARQLRTAGCVCSIIGLIIVLIITFKFWVFVGVMFELATDPDALNNDN